MTDGTTEVDQLADTAMQLVSAGVDFFQLRYKSLSAKEVYEIALPLANLTRNVKMNLVINDRIDVAQAVDLSSVHLGEVSLPVSAARAVLGNDALIGRSVHSLEEAIRAEQEGASYITYGHIFTSLSKPGLPPRGLSSLGKIVESVSVPVIAIGGITEHNFEQVLATGAAGIAVIGAIMSQKNPGEAAKRLRELLDRSKYQPRSFK
ncbi:MAG: thiE [Bacilli bacterium]|nr:thiE [Bacilli bacterium]